MQMCSLLFTRTFWGKRFQWCVCLCLDYIAAAGSQEDDIHNVQSVIDSLSLDYLQISLSHITGENVIRGDKDSIKNLLEIFDGLLEYLKEEMIEESQNDGIAALRNSTVTEEPEQSSSSIGESLVHASKLSLHSSDAEEQRSDGEFLGLAVSARTFTAKQEEFCILLLRDYLIDDITRLVLRYSQQRCW
ncbi:centrosomal protein of 95 kDa-like isoform X3 [Takifugu rubripes]|uniref:centrosomal protein of 95 kDa-like isoform X3 n=2 Tax=Takifugu rubripes TaxID=31033 RepID=UPI0011456D54|nr:centrosomal protein of 95 kDa-like isoform X3 [Takifugu rubripes]